MTPKNNDKLLSLARKRFDQCVTAETNNRARAVQDLRFRYGEQWPDVIQAERSEENRPCLTLNKIPTFIRNVINDIRQTRPALKIRPGDARGTKETAKVISGMIRAIEQSCNAETAYDWAAEYAATIGWGYWRVLTEYESPESFDQIIKIARVQNPFSVYLDPDRKETDGSDSKFGFVLDVMNKEDFEEKYPNAQSEWNGEGEGTHREKWFADDKIQVAEYWVIEEEEFTLYQLSTGDVVKNVPPEFEELIVRQRKSCYKRITQYIVTGVEVLEQTSWAGQYIPIIECRGEELNIEGETKLNGMVKDLKDAQRNYNYWRTSSTERVALAPKAPWVGAKGAFQDPKWKHANRKNYAYLEYNPVENQQAPERTTPPDISPGITQEIMMSAEEFKSISGIYDPALGDRSNEVAGVAIKQRQQRSDISNFHYVDNLARSIRHTGRVLVDLIPKIFDTPRLTQIINQDGTEEQVAINQQHINPKTQKPQHFDLKTGRYSVSVDIGPGYATLRQESVDGMTQLISVNPAAGALISDLIAKASDWPDSDEAAKRLRMLLPANIEGEENPQVKAIITQAQGQVQQMQTVIGQLVQMVNEKDLLLKNKQGELALKYQEMIRKYKNLDDKTSLDVAALRQDLVKFATELEVKEKQNIPGSAV